MDWLYRYIGDNVRTARKERGITQAKLAEELNVSPPHFSSMERGKKHFSIAQLYSISKCLDISMLTFFIGLDDTKTDIDSIINKSDALTTQALQEFSQILKKCTREETAAIIEICRILSNCII